MEPRLTMLIIVILYFTVVLGIGAYASKSASKSAEDYILGGRRMPPAILALTMMAYMWAGGPTTVGGAGWVWSSGIQAPIWVNSGSAFGFAFGGVILAPFLRRMALQTMPDILAPDRSNVGSRLVAGLILVFRQAISIGVDLIAIGVMASAVLPGVSYHTVVVAATFVTVIYTLMGGLWAIALTDTIQILLVFAGIAFMLPIYMVTKAGGLANVSAYFLSHPELVYGPSGVPYDPIMGFSLFFMTGVFGYLDQGMYQRYYSAKRPKDAITASMAMGMQWAMCPAIFSIIITAARMPGVLPAEALSMIGEHPDKFLPALILHMLPPVAGGFIVAVVLAAMMSSADALYLSIGTNISIDIWRKIIKRDSPNITDKQILNVTRVGVVIAGVVAMLIALPYGFADTMVHTQFYAYRISIAFFGPIFGCLFWKKITQQSMIWSMICTVIVVFAWGLTGLDSLTGIADSTVPALIVNLVLTVVISLKTYKPKPGDSGGTGSKVHKVTPTSVMNAIVMLISTMHPAPILRSQVEQGLREKIAKGGVRA